ncbi:MAG: hypothetical protein NTV24_02340 [Candidatus Woesebacteria bacterium]|nr:hypothetical protein [Candidatus Woesebacteria bacterium]
MVTKFNIPKIPLLGVPDAPLMASSQEHLPISDICEDIVLFKDGGAALVMESTSLNFSLLSEKEQEAVIAAYSALLNSLSFSVQIVVRSQKKDISTYMNYLDESAKKIANPGLYRLMQSYRKFIIESVKKKNVLGKRFYVVLPFSSLELGIAKSVLAITKRNGPLPYPKSYVIKKAKVVLYPRRDHLIRQMGRLGIKLRQLETDDLVNLYYEVYNPIKPEERKKEY